MAKERVIEINGDIGGYAYSMGYINYMLKDLGEGPVTVKVTSYGGDVNHALKIKNAFATHGDVTVEYIGLNASSATLIGHGAKKTVIHEDSLYLIHKPMVWVDAWGLMNEDELTQAISDFQAQKKDAETFTLVLAQDYVNSRGMDIKTVMELMKEARWLSAKETVDLGLVDEIIPSKNKKPVISNQAIAMMTANGLPLPVFENKEVQSDKSIADKITDGFARIENAIKNSFTSNNPPKMEKQFTCINQVLNVEGLEAKDKKVEMTIEQITALNDKIQNLTNDLATSNANNRNAVSAQNTAETSLTTLLNSLDSIDPTIKNAVDPTAKIAAINAKLASRPGVPPAAPQNTEDSKYPKSQKDAADWDTIDNLPHNREADQSIY